MGQTAKAVSAIPVSKEVTAVLYREDLEEREKKLLSDKACRSAESRGRAVYEEPCRFRTDFQRDRDRIIHSKAFRRLMHKTQVFIAPEGDHYRTRLTHTLEVSQVARTISRNLGLNEDLTEAIAMGHDLGHTPFGHNGEAVLNEIHPGGFRHNEQSLRVVEIFGSSPGGRGMNLTYEVRDGILNHTGKNIPCTLEGQAVRISDRIAYINHDIDDAVRSGIITADDLPKEPIEFFGKTNSARIGSMITNVILTSDGKDTVAMDEENTYELGVLRGFMFENVYNSSRVRKEENLAKIEMVISSLYKYFLEHPKALPEEYIVILKEEGINMAVKDYIAGMTDRYALNLYSELFVPRGWK